MGIWMIYKKKMNLTLKKNKICQALYLFECLIKMNNQNKLKVQCDSCCGLTSELSTHISWKKFNWLNSFIKVFFLNYLWCIQAMKFTVKVNQFSEIVLFHASIKISAEMFNITFFKAYAHIFEHISDILIHLKHCQNRHVFVITFNL